MPQPIDLLQTNRPASLVEARELINEARRKNVSYFPSPIDWRNEILYFLLPDRFSDGQEATRPLLSRQEIRNLRNSADRTDMNWESWATSALRWQGGTLKGIESKLDYLITLGITTIWVAPVFKQRARLDTFHGYGVQDFLDVDPRFGSRKDLVELIATAHAKKVKVILDIIINHSGNNWGYVPPQASLDNAVSIAPFRHFPDYYSNPDNPEMKEWKTAWRNELGICFTENTTAITGEDDGGWPRELQDFKLYTRAGNGSLSDNDIGNTHAEHKRTDFFDLKDFALDAPQALNFLSDCFKYWIALTDCDGFRIDTVKHISLEETRNFCGSILEFAETIGKHNFFLVGEIAGGDQNQDFVLDNLARLQRNLKAALDIGSSRVLLHQAGKGLAPLHTYIETIKEESEGFESHRSFGDRHVSILDDHDHVTGEKIRFSSEIPDDLVTKDYQVVVPTALQLFTLGIPCIYYGSEQAFAGPARSQIQYLLNHGWKNGNNWGDRYLREAMFGPIHPRAKHDQDINIQLTDKDTSLPGFGAFGTIGKHCFDIDSPAYVRIAALCKVRAQYGILRFGRQYARQTRVFGSGFSSPVAGELAAWSRILDNHEAICIVNANGETGAIRGGDIVVSSELCKPGDTFTVVTNTAEVAAVHAGETYTGSHPANAKVQVKGRVNPNEPAFIEIRNIPPAEVVVLLKDL